MEGFTLGLLRLWLSSLWLEHGRRLLGGVHDEKLSEEESGNCPLVVRIQSNYCSFSLFVFIDDLTYNAYPSHSWASLEVERPGGVRVGQHT